MGLRIIAILGKEKHKMSETYQPIWQGLTSTAHGEPEDPITEEGSESTDHNNKITTKTPNGYTQNQKNFEISIKKYPMSLEANYILSQNKSINLCM